MGDPAPKGTAPADDDLRNAPLRDGPVSALRASLGRTFASLSSPNLRWFFGGNLISLTGSWVQMVALPWLVLHLTGSGTALGLVAAAQTVPVLVLGAFAGVVVDRCDRRRLVLFTSTLLALLALTVGVLTLMDLATLPVLLVLAVLMGIGTALDNPGRRTFLSELVPPDQVGNAVSLNNAVFTSARIFGPAVAGVAIASVGIGWCFVINAASFGAVVFSVLMVRPATMHRNPPAARAKRQLREGLAHLWQDRMIRLAFLMTFILGTLAFNYPVVLPLLARRTFDAGAGSYALMFILVSVGSLVGALAVAHRASPSGRMMLWGSVAFGLAMAVAALAPTLLVEYIVLVPMGLTSMLFFTSSSALSQERMQPEFRGRVSAMFSVAYVGSTPIGAPIVGAVCQNFGARAGLALGAGASLVCGIVGLTLLGHWLHERSESGTAAPAQA